MHREKNIKILQDSYYPTNLQSVSVVSVTYELIDSIDSDMSRISFGWFNSPVHLTINKELLNGLSLRTYVPETSMLVLPFNVSERCQDSLVKELVEIEELRSSNNISMLCKGCIKLLEVLNNFTTNVSQTL